MVRVSTGSRLQSIGWVLGKEQTTGDQAAGVDTAEPGMACSEGPQCWGTLAALMLFYSPVSSVDRPTAELRLMHLQSPRDRHN
ncbi:hypothetical protein ACOMHN_027718 [Nucella lapillus]